MLKVTQPLKNLSVNRIKSIKTAGKRSKRGFHAGNTLRSLNKSHKLSQANSDLQIIH